MENALKKAPEVAELVAPKRPARQPKTKQQHRIVDALNESLKATSRREGSRKQWNDDVRRFLAWLVNHYPDCKYWHMLNRQIVREYLSVYNGKSDNTKRLLSQPIRQTAGYMSREYGYHNFAERLGTGTKNVKETPDVYLMDVVAFCDFVREFNPRIEAGVALQGLAGLQLQEATRLTWDRVNLEKGIIEISGEVKNEYRNRVIPVADRVIEALKRCYRLQQQFGEENIIEVNNHVLLSPQGYDFCKWWKNYSQEVDKAIKAWNPQLKWTPKDLRNCLPTFAVMAGLQNDFWEQYSGRAPRTIYAKHYVPRLATVSKGEREALEQQMKFFHFHVVDHLNKAIAGECGIEILNFFELGANDSLPGSKSQDKRKAANL